MMCYMQACGDRRLPLLQSNYASHADAPRTHAAARRDHARRSAQRTPSPTRSPLHLLERTQHNVSKAARLAGIDRNYLYRMMKKHGIARKE